MTPVAHRFCIAPMMEWTDRHCRVFHRLLTQQAMLYTEMVTADAVRFGSRDRLLRFSAVEHPVAAQLGGSEPEAMAEAARIVTSFEEAAAMSEVPAPKRAQWCALYCGGSKRIRATVAKAARSCGSVGCSRSGRPSTGSSATVATVA